jgi:hypothetical protein
VVDSATQDWVRVHYYDNEPCPEEAEVIILSELSEYSDNALNQAIGLAKERNVPVIGTSPVNFTSAKPWQSELIKTVAAFKNSELQESLGVQVFHFIAKFDPRLSAERLWEWAESEGCFSTFCINVFGFPTGEAVRLWEISQSGKTALFQELSRIMDVDLTP